MPPSSEIPSSILDLQAQYRKGQANVGGQVEIALHQANSNAGRNVYLARDAAWVQRETERLLAAERQSAALWGIPISLKDCLDLEGFITSCGSQFLAKSREPATVDSAVATRLRSAGAVIMGKTHLHQLTMGLQARIAITVIVFSPLMQIC